MSIASMTEVAFQRRTDVGAPEFAPKTLRDVAGAAGGKQAPDTTINTALKTMVTYIPTEVITLYLAVVAALQLPAGSPPAVWTFGSFLAFTPLVVWLVYATKAKSDGKPVPLAPRAWPVWEMVAGTIAFAAWALAIPQQPFSSFPPALSAVGVLITSTVLGLLAPLFSRALKP
jgi:hypothetical protein